MLKRIISFAATATVGLTISGNLMASGLCNKRQQTSPACHPSFGYHQTCWRRFPNLPPCDTCDPYGTGLSQSICEDGTCQISPNYEPHPMTMGPQTAPIYPPGAHSGRYGTGQSPIPMDMQSMNMGSVHNMPESASPFGGHSVQQLAPTPTTGGRYQSSQDMSLSPQPMPLSRPLSAPMAPRPAPAPSGTNSRATEPNGLPQIPTGMHRSSGISIPSQSRVLPGGGRYRSVSAGTVRQPVQSMNQAVAPVIGGTQSRYSGRPRRVHAQLLAAPLLRQPVSQ